MSISAAQVKELRDKTGAGIMDCKQALAQTDGDMAKAADILRQKGIASAEKRSGRSTGEGRVASYIHGGKVGVLIEVNCETDFVAKNQAFGELVNELAMQIAAMNPTYLSQDEIPAEVVAKELEGYKKAALEEGKPEEVAQKIADGKVRKYFEGLCLIDQPYMRDAKKKVSDLITEAIAKTGENIRVRRFTRYELGK